MSDGEGEDADNASADQQMDDPKPPRRRRDEEGKESMQDAREGGGKMAASIAFIGLILSGVIGYGNCSEQHEASRIECFRTRLTAADQLEKRRANLAKEANVLLGHLAPEKEDLSTTVEQAASTKNGAAQPKQETRSRRFVEQKLALEMAKATICDFRRQSVRFSTTEDENLAAQASSNGQGSALSSDTTAKRSSGECPDTNVVLRKEIAAQYAASSRWILSAVALLGAEADGPVAAHAQRVLDDMAQDGCFVPSPVASASTVHATPTPPSDARASDDVKTLASAEIGGIRPRVVISYPAGCPKDFVDLFGRKIGVLSVENRQPVVFVNHPSSMAAYQIAVGNQGRRTEVRYYRSKDPRFKDVDRTNAAVLKEFVEHTLKSDVPTASDGGVVAVDLFDSDVKFPYYEVWLSIDVCRTMNERERSAATSKEPPK